MKKIIKKIKANGGKIYLVGGAVRDQIMGVEPYDLDYVVTGLTIDQMVTIFGDCISGTNAPVWQTEFGEIALARKERRNGIGYNGFQFYTSHSITIEEAKPLHHPIFAVYADGRELITPSYEEALTFYKSGKTDSIWKACRSKKESEKFLKKIRTLLS